MSRYDHSLPFFTNALFYQRLLKKILNLKTPNGVIVNYDYRTKDGNGGQLCSSDPGLENKT